MTDGSITASVEDAEALVGFKLTFPTYLPDRMIAPGQVQVFITAGSAYQVSIPYYVPDGEQDTVNIIDMLVVEGGSPPANFGLGERVEVEGTNVYIKFDNDSFFGEWTQESILFNINLFARNEATGGDMLRSEGVRVIQSIVGAN